MAEAKEMPPFWLEPNTCRRRSSQFSSMFLDSRPLRVILLVIAFIFVFHVVPSFLSFSSHVLAPRSIKKGWDSLNLVLVLFAIVCGFLRRNNNDDNNKINDHEGASYYGDRHVTNVQQDAQPSYPSTPRRWYDHYHDLKALVSVNRLRSFRSYPDLRLESSWLANDEQWRFHDDTQEHKDLNFKNSSVPPPSPPPPSPHFLQNPFPHKKGKTKKVLSLPPPPPPPLPPPPTISSASLTRGSKIAAKNVTPPPLESRASRIKATQVAPVTSHDDKRPKQVKTSRLKSMEENVDSGNASPFIPIPPPPFRIEPWKFLVVGDYVRVASFNSSRSGSLDLESLEDPSDEESSSPMATAVYGGGDTVTRPLPCPSPDVNTKAENFIAKVRAGWRS